MWCCAQGRKTCWSWNWSSGGKPWREVSRAKTEHMCLNGTPLGSIQMQSAQLPQVTEFKYLGSTLQSDGDMRIDSTEINKRTQCGWNNWRKMSGVLCDTRVPPHDKGKIHKTIFQPAMLYGMETVPVTSSHVKKLEVTEMKMCRWACGHTLRDHVRNDDIREKLKVQNITERCQKSKTEVVWSRKEARPRIRRNKYSGEEKEENRSWDGWLCQPRHESHRNDERWSPWQNWLEENCVCRSDPTTKWERLEEEEDARIQTHTHSLSFPSDTMKQSNLSIIDRVVIRVVLL